MSIAQYVITGVTMIFGAVMLYVGVRSMYLMTQVEDLVHSRREASASLLALGASAILAGSSFTFTDVSRTAWLAFAPLGLVTGVAGMFVGLHANKLARDLKAIQHGTTKENN